MGTTQENAAEEAQRIITELRRERDAALAREAALAEVLNVINRSPDDPGPVFDAILKKAQTLCGAEMGGLQAWDGEYCHVLAMLGYPGDIEGPMRQPFRPGIGHEPVLAGERFSHYPDVSNAEVRPDEDPRVVAWIERSGARTWLLLPLRGEAGLIGFVSVARKVVRAFSDAEIALLESFAVQAVIAMETARLMGELRARTSDLQESLEYQTATSDVLKVISSSTFDLQPVLDTMVETAARLCDAEMAATFQRDGEFWRLAANFGFPPEFEAHQKALGRIATNPMTPTVGQRSVIERRPVHIHDVAAVPSYPEESIVLGRMRTALAVPLLREGEAIGNILLARQRVEPFTERQIELVSTFADQAVIAIENARLLEELRQRTSDLQESLEYQTATSDVLKVISSSTFNVDPVFQAVVTTAVRLCQADQATIYRYHDGEYRWAAGYSLTPDYERIEREVRIRPGTGTLVGRVALESRTTTILDAWTDPLYEAGEDARIGGVHTMLGVPLLRDGVPIGVIALARTRIEPFSDRQIALVSTFADQAVIAIENARLMTEQQEALEQQTATAEVLQVINASPGNLRPVFETLLEKAVRLTEGAFGTIATYDGERFHSEANRGVPAAVAAAVRPMESPAGSPIGLLLETKRPVHILDLKDFGSYRTGHLMSRTLVDLGGVCTDLVVPLLKDGAVSGIIAVHRQEVRAFSDKQIALLENFAAQAVIAIENARLLQELRARTDELAQRQEELRLTFENMGDGVAMFDQEPRLVAWNTRFQEMFAVPDDLLQQRLVYADYIRHLAQRGDYGPDVDIEEQVRRIAANIGQYRVTERTRPDGRVIEIRNNPVTGGGFVLMFSDITERKRNEAEIAAARDAAQEATRTIEAAFRDLKAAQANLVQAEKMASLGQLTAGIAHEIKNPLNFVNNFASLSVDLLAELKEAAAPGFALLNDDQRAEIDDVSNMLTSNLQKITEHGKRADGIVKAMLEHSRGASGERREVDLNALVDEALNLAYHGARAQDQSFNITLERDFAAGIAPIEVNPQDITRVFLNLFSNGFYAANKRARDNAPPGFNPTLTVITRDLGDHVEINVRDNGTGIPDNIRDKLFEPFFTTKPTGEGTGLGLSITYDIVTKQHGGTIAVESKVGDHTAFSIGLPRHMFANEGDRA